MSKKEIYKWNSGKTDKENIENKLAQMRELIWEKFPDNQGEMIGDPFSVLIYYEKYTKTLASQLEERDKLIKKLLDEYVGTYDSEKAHGDKDVIEWGKSS